MASGVTVPVPVGAVADRICQACPESNRRKHVVLVFVHRAADELGDPARLNRAQTRLCGPLGAEKAAPPGLVELSCSGGGGQLAVGWDNWISFHEHLL